MNYSFGSSIEKINCPRCNNLVFDFEVLIYTLDGKEMLICPKCPTTIELIDLYKEEGGK